VLQCSMFRSSLRYEKLVSLTFRNKMNKTQLLKAFVKFFAVMTLFAAWLPCEVVRVVFERFAIELTKAGEYCAEL